MDMIVTDLAVFGGDDRTGPFLSAQPVPGVTASHVRVAIGADDLERLRPQLRD